MALDINAAKQLIQARGVQPPAGLAVGSPEYDQWAIQWFQGAINAGDPAAIKAAGGSVAEGGGAEDVISDWSGAAPASSWFGQRKPTPGELRRYARDKGQSEDYARFSDRQLADWINRKWNIGGGYFTNDYGDVVEKPTESGAQSQAAGAATGEAGVGGGGGGGGGRGRAAPQAGAAAYQALDDPLQASLYQLAQSRGLQGQRGITDARSLAGGGILTWGQPGTTSQAPGTPAAPTPAGGVQTPPQPQTNEFQTTQQVAQPRSAWPSIGVSQPSTPLDKGIMSKFAGRGGGGPQQWWMK